MPTPGNPGRCPGYGALSDSPGGAAARAILATASAGLPLCLSRDAEVVVRFEVGRPKPQRLAVAGEPLHRGAPGAGQHCRVIMRIGEIRPQTNRLAIPLGGLVMPPPASPGLHRDHYARGHLRPVSDRLHGTHRSTGRSCRRRNKPRPVAQASRRFPARRRRPARNGPLPGRRGPPRRAVRPSATNAAASPAQGCPRSAPARSERPRPEDPPETALILPSWPTHVLTDPPVE